MALFDIDVAISAHKNWRSKLEFAIDGISGEKLNADNIADDHCCVLGGWLFGKGGDEYGSFAKMAELKEAHMQFHAIAARVVRLCDKGNTDGATELLTTEFDALSNTVVDLLTELHREHEPKRQ